MKINSYSVSDIVFEIKSIIEKEDLKNIWVRGEVSNVSQSETGHIYFSLKDKYSILKCVFFSFKNQFFDLDFLQNGKEVYAQGSISVFEKGGYYNLNINKVKQIGKGDIYQKIEKLKKELHQKGIFDSKHKKTIHPFNFNIGVATSLTGAALKDIIQTATQRFPNIHLFIAPCLVQGKESVDSIVRAIQLLNQKKWKLDVILAGRGGGSFEDLIAFNEKKVVMAFFHSKVPIVSAVGHQIDFVLSDLTADAYVATPTAAAELVVPNFFKIQENILKSKQRIDLQIKNHLEKEKKNLKMIVTKTVFEDPYFFIHSHIQRLDFVTVKIKTLSKEKFYLIENQISQYDNLDYLLQSLLQKAKQKLEQISHKIQTAFIFILNENKRQFVQLEKIDVFIHQNLQIYQKDFQILSEKIESYSHKKILVRGYSIVKNQKNETISSSSQVQPQETLNIIFHKGKIQVICSDEKI